MKTKLMRCPGCGGELEIDRDMDVFFCKYCGTKIMLDRSEEKRMAHKERMKDKQLKMRKWQHAEDIFDGLFVILLGVIFIVMLLIVKN